LVPGLEGAPAGLVASGACCSQRGPSTCEEKSRGANRQESPRRTPAGAEGEELVLRGEALLRT